MYNMKCKKFDLFSTIFIRFGKYSLQEKSDIYSFILNLLKIDAIKPCFT